jgi:large subunit ribosomal protein L4
MGQIAVRNWKNESLRTIDLDAALFDYPYKAHLIFEAVCAYRAAARRGTHKTKTRGEVSGGTKKLWKQKHTGRARMGDNRSPLWRHGGTVQGPQPRDYSWRFPRRMRRNALRSALAMKLREGKVLCLDSFALETHRTKDLAAKLRDGLGLESKTLLVAWEPERNLTLASRNQRGVSLVPALGMSIVDLVDCDTVVIEEQALGRLAEVLAR